MVWNLCSMDSSNITKEFSEKRKRKIPLGTKGRISILSYREYRASWVASFPVSKRKLPDRECFVTTFRQGGYTPLRRLRVYPLWDLPSANGFDKPSAASKFEKGQLCTGKHICNLKLTKCISRKIDNDTSLW